jgi:hypothetical protein
VARRQGDKETRRKGDKGKRRREKERTELGHRSRMNSDSQSGRGCKYFVPIQET